MSQIVKLEVTKNEAETIVEALQAAGENDLVNTLYSALKWDDAEPTTWAAEKAKLKTLDHKWEQLADKTDTLNDWWRGTKKEANK